MEQTIKIAITHGDMNGIGYEVILKTLSDSRVFETCTPILYGCSKAAAFYRKNLNLEEMALNLIKSPSEAIPKRINVINCIEGELKVDMGMSTNEAGEASFLALERATADLQAGLVQALVTAPINKRNIQSEQFQFPGHTEYLEKKFGKDESLMFFVSDSMKVALVTNHVPIAKVSDEITEDLIVKKLYLLDKSLREDFMIVRPRIAVLALNPHAGDEGLIGKEEQSIIAPALKRAQEKGIVCVGPLSADGFFGANTYSSYDAILAMYHDQALAPFKALFMDEGVNFTAGLPIVRTSPTHGTAYDKVGKDCASENSFRHALYLAIDVYHRRLEYKEMKANPLKVEQKNRFNNKVE